MAHVKYTLHEYREGRHALAGDDICTGPLLEFVTDYAGSLRGLKYVVVETRTEFIREDGGDGALEYDEKAYAVITRGRTGEDFSMGPWLPFTDDMYALVDLRVTWPRDGGGRLAPSVNVRIPTYLDARARARLVGYIEGGLTADALEAAFGTACVPEDVEHCRRLPEVGDRMDDLLNAMAHRLKGDA